MVPSTFFLILLGSEMFLRCSVDDVNNGTKLFDTDTDVCIYIILNMLWLAGAVLITGMCILRKIRKKIHLAIFRMVWC